jgi:hypothetical protein
VSPRFANSSASRAQRWHSTSPEATDQGDETPGMECGVGAGVRRRRREGDRGCWIGEEMWVAEEGRGGREGELGVVGMDGVEPAIADGGGDSRERGESGKRWIWKGRPWTD